ncbi:mitochondrial ATPase expression-domain-containing protein [Aspergillus aurantiobrunneus]
MRVIVSRCERLASHLFCPSCPLVSRRRFHQLRPVAASTPQFARWFTTSGSLAAWNRDNAMVSKPKGNQRVHEPVSEPRSDAGSTPATGSSDWEIAPSSRGLENLDALKRDFYSILETAQPDQVMAAMLNYDYEELVATMPQSVFVEALHLLSPAYFVEPYREIYRPLHPYSVEVKQGKSQQTIFDDFVRNLSAIVQIRRSAGHTLGLAEYTHLLDCARSLGDAMMADYTWHSMKRDGVVPDLQCYNHYMEAKIWDLAYTGREKYNLRMTSRLYKKRKFGDPGWEGYGTASRSVRKEVREIFNEMTEAGNEADEASIVSLMMASARVGHDGGMRSLLKIIWNIDVDALASGSPEGVTEYDRTSPLYPSSRLLRAVAHAFSTNNDIPSALRIIEHVSNAYDIEVPVTVWAELFEWSFVLSRPRHGRHAALNSIGFVSSDFFQNLFETMTREPYNVTPTVEMHHKLAKTAWVFRRLKDFVHHMRAAYKIMDETRRKRIAAREMVESYLRHPRLAGRQMDPRILLSRGFADAVHAYDVLRLQVMQQTIMIERLARLLIFRDRWTGRNYMAWERQLLPQAIEEWRDFIPETFMYYTHSGLVQFYGQTAFGDARVHNHSALQVRRPSLNDDFTVDQASTELDDDVIWAKYQNDMSRDDLNFALLRRLFHPVRIEYDTDNTYSDVDDEAFIADLPTDNEVYDKLNSNSTESTDPAGWAMRAYYSREQKNAVLQKTFGPFPGPLADYWEAEDIGPV